MSKPNKTRRKRQAGIKPYLSFLRRKGGGKYAGDKIHLPRWAGNPDIEMSEPLSETGAMYVSADTASDCEIH